MGGKTNEQEKNDTRRLKRELYKEATSKTRKYQVKKRKVVKVHRWNGNLIVAQNGRVKVFQYRK